MTKERPTQQKESFLSSQQDISSEIQKLLDPKMGKEQWRQNWQDNKFAKIFPNLIPQLLILPEENKKNIFYLAYTTFMDSPSSSSTHAARLGGIFLRISDHNPLLWEPVGNRTQTPNKESLARIETDCLVLLGLSLKDKESAKDTIADSYNILSKNNSTSNRARKFRENIFTTLVKNSPFRRWIKINNLDQDSGFDWDREVTRLALWRLFPPSQKIIPDKQLPDGLPKELTSELKNFTPPGIDEFANYALGFAAISPITGARADDLRTFIIEVRSLPSDFFQGTDLLEITKGKIEALESLLPSHA